MMNEYFEKYQSLQLKELKRSLLETAQDSQSVGRQAYGNETSFWK